MSEPPSLDHIAYVLERLERSVDGLRNDVVRKDVYEAQREADRERVNGVAGQVEGLEKARKEDAAERVTDKRWRIGLIVTSGSAIVLMFISIIVDLSRAAS